MSYPGYVKPTAVLCVSKAGMNGLIRKLSYYLIAHACDGFDGRWVHLHGCRPLRIFARDPHRWSGRAARDGRLFLFRPDPSLPNGRSYLSQSDASFSLALAAWTRKSRVATEQM
jgi:hypothetical protein